MKVAKVQMKDSWLNDDYVPLRTIFSLKSTARVNQQAITQNIYCNNAVHETKKQEPRTPPFSYVVYPNYWEIQDVLVFVYIVIFVSIIMVYLTTKKGKLTNLNFY